MYKIISKGTISRINGILNPNNILYKTNGFSELSLEQGLNTMRHLHKDNASFFKTLRYLKNNPELLNISLNNAITFSEMFKCDSSTLWNKILFTDNLLNPIKYTYKTFIENLSNPSNNFLRHLYDARLGFTTPNILPIEQQISGLISPNKTLLTILNAPESKEAQDYIKLTFLKALSLFKDNALTEKEFLARLPDYFGAIDVPMPAILEKHFGPVALLQHCFNIATAYKTFDKDLITTLSNNTINVDYLPRNLPAQNFVESTILVMNNLDTVAKENNMTIYAVNQDFPEKVPHYDQTFCVQACDQPNVDFLAVGSTTASNDTLLIKPHDIKTGGLRALTLSRVTIVHHSDTWSLTKVKNFISDHINQLNGILKNMPEGPEKAAYIYLQKKFKENFKESKHLSPKNLLRKINDTKKDIIYEPIYRHLYVSIHVDAGISGFNAYILSNNLEEKIMDDPETLDILLFPKNSTVNVIETHKVLKRLVRTYFSGEEQRTILENLDRLGIGNTALAIEG